MFNSGGHLGLHKYWWMTIKWSFSCPVWVQTVPHSENYLHIPHNTPMFHYISWCRPFWILDLNNIHNPSNDWFRQCCGASDEFLNLLAQSSMLHCVPWWQSARIFFIVKRIFIQYDNSISHVVPKTLFSQSKWK